MGRFRALIHVLRGTDDPVKPGETIPPKYTDHEGQEHDVDFDRLVELGAAEKDTGKKNADDADESDADLNKLSRDELDTLAESHGVENPAGLPNKGAVIAAIQAAE